MSDDMAFSPQFILSGIDYRFIVKCETGGGDDGLPLGGVIPVDRRTDEPLGHSGTTFSAGVDIGQVDKRELSRLTDGYPQLYTKLEPFIGKRGAQAQQALQQYPTQLTPEEAEILCYRKYNAIADRLVKNHDKIKGEGSFAKHSRAVKTIVLSVAVQYGANLAKRTPRFWACLLANDMQAMQNELRNFGDKYPTRRQAEADYLKDNYNSASLRA